MGGNITLAQKPGGAQRNESGGDHVAISRNLETGGDPNLIDRGETPNVAMAEWGL